MAEVHRRLTKALAAIGSTAFMIGTVSAVVELKPGSHASAASNEGPPAVVLQYWTDTRLALSPLLQYVRILPGSIAAISASGGSVTAGQVQEAREMADSFATARDLVGRLVVPAAAPASAGELMQLACQFYRESALAIVQAKSTGPGAQALSTLRRAASLQAVGDRIIDQVRRVLRIDQVGQQLAPTEFRYAPPVPSVSAVTGVTGPFGSGNSSIDSELATGRALVDRLTTSDVASDPRGMQQQLTAVATGLETANHDGEDVIGARIAVLTTLLAENAAAQGQAEAAAELLMLANDTWNSARSLVARPHSALTAIGASITPRSRVWTGGSFNGAPPPLRPGESVGADLPGGLPKIDAEKIVKG